MENSEELNQEMPSFASSDLNSQRTNDQIRAEIIQIILNSSNSQTMLSALASKIGQFFQVDACLIFCHNLDSFNPIRMGLWQETTLPVLHEDEIVPGLSQLTKSQASREQLIIVNDRQQYLGDLLDEQWAQIPAKAWLGMVTRFQKKANGLILLLKAQPYSWTSSEQELFTQVSESMAIAISQIQLQQQAKTRTRYQDFAQSLG